MADLRTTFAGLLAFVAIAASVASQVLAGAHGWDALFQIENIAALIAGLGILLTGYFAKDADKKKRKPKR